MMFGVYRCKKDPEHFVVTDAAHAGELRESWCPRGGALEKVGECPEIGAQRTLGIPLGPLAGALRIRL